MSIIADLIRAGVDPELIQRVHEEIVDARREATRTRLEPMGEVDADRYLAEINKRLERSERNARYYQKRLKASESRLKASESDVSDVLQKGSDGSPNDITLTPSLPPKTKPPLRSGLERARARRTSLDADPIAFDLDFARQAGLDSLQTAREFDQFLDHHRKNGSLMADWHAAWRTWVRNAIKFQARAGPGGRSNGVRGFLANVAQLMADGTDSRTEGSNGGSHQAVLGFPERR